MSHDDDLLDATMKQIYETFGKPGADENPPRNHYCGRCQQWVATRESHNCEW